MTLRHQQVSAAAAQTNRWGNWDWGAGVSQTSGRHGAPRSSSAERFVHSAQFYIYVFSAAHRHRRLMSQLMFVWFPYRQLSVGSCTTDSSLVLKSSRLSVLRLRWTQRRPWLVRALIIMIGYWLSELSVRLFLWESASMCLTSCVFISVMQSSTTDQINFCDLRSVTNRKERF